MVDIANGCSILVGVFMLAAGIRKLQQVSEFRRQLADYQLVPAQALSALAWGLPVAEVVVGILTLAPATRAAGAVGTTLLLGVFSVAAIINIRRGNTEISCACLGASSTTRLGWRIPIRNVAMGAPLAIVALGTTDRDPGLHGLAGAALVALIGLVLWTFAGLKESVQALSGPTSTRAVGDHA